MYIIILKVMKSTQYYKISGMNGMLKCYFPIAMAEVHVLIRVLKYFLVSIIIITVEVYVLTIASFPWSPKFRTRGEPGDKAVLTLAVPGVCWSPVVYNTADGSFQKQSQ